MSSGGTNYSKRQFIFLGNEENFENMKSFLIAGEEFEVIGKDERFVPHGKFVIYITAVLLSTPLLIIFFVYSDVNCAMSQL